MAHAAGIRLTWQDISELSDVVPLLARVYPNGPADRAGVAGARARVAVGDGQPPFFQAISCRVPS